MGLLRAGLAAAAGACALAGCGAAPEAEPAAAAPVTVPERAAEAPRAPAPKLPAGFRLRRVADTPLSLALPRGWMALGHRDAVFPGAAKTLARATPSLAAPLAALMMADSPLKLLGFDRTATLNVLAVPAAPGPFASWSRTVARQVRAMPSFRPPLRASRVALAGRDALRLEYARASGGRRLATVQYVLVDGDAAYVLVYAAPAAHGGRYVGVFDASALTASLAG